MQVFTKDFKAIREALNKCWQDRARKGSELLKLQEGRKKIFGDIALGKVSSTKKEILNRRIRELKEDIEDINISVEELTERETVLKKTGGDIEEGKID